MQHVGKIPLTGGVAGEGCAERNIIERVLGTDAGQLQRMVKAFAQLREEGERSAKIGDLSLDRTALRQSGDGLVDHRRKDRGGKVAVQGTLIQKRLDVRFGEHPASGCNGVKPGGVGGLLVHLAGGAAKQGCHLIDEGAGASRAGAVHPHLQTVGQEKNLGVLASKLDGGVDAGHPVGQCDAGCEYLLHEGNAAALGHPHPGGTGDGNLGGFAVGMFLPDAGQQLRCLLDDLGIVTFIGAGKNCAVLSEHDALNGGGTDINANSQRLHLVLRRPPRGGASCCSCNLGIIIKL